MATVVHAPSGELDLPVAVSLAPEEVLVHLSSDTEGLSTAEAASRLASIVPNILGTNRGRASAILISQVKTRSCS